MCNDLSATFYSPPEEKEGVSWPEPKACRSPMNPDAQLFESVFVLTIVRR
jgi:hypothetical protein